VCGQIRHLNTPIPPLIFDLLVKPSARRWTQRSPSKFDGASLCWTVLGSDTIQDDEIRTVDSVN